MPDEIRDRQTTRNQPVGQVNAAHGAADNGPVFVVHNTGGIPILELAPDPLAGDEIFQGGLYHLPAMIGFTAQHTLLAGLGGVHAPKTKTVPADLEAVAVDHARPTLIDRPALCGLGGRGGNQDAGDGKQQGFHG